jgi:hypothetical protein
MPIGQTIASTHVPGHGGAIVLCLAEEEAGRDHYGMSLLIGGNLPGVLGYSHAALPELIERCEQANFRLMVGGSAIRPTMPRSGCTRVLASGMRDCSRRSAGSTDAGLTRC